jgi:hypothetical protein
MSSELPSNTNFEYLESHVLLFKTPDGALLGWNILTDLPIQEIDHQLDVAMHEWSSNEEGNAQEEGIDYATTLMKIPPEILAKYRIFPGIPIHEIIALDTKVNLLSEESKPD